MVKNDTVKIFIACFFGFRKMCVYFSAAIDLYAFFPSSCLEVEKSKSSSQTAACAADTTQSLPYFVQLLLLSLVFFFLTKLLQTAAANSSSWFLRPARLFSLFHIYFFNHALFFVLLFLLSFLSCNIYLR